MKNLITLLTVASVLTTSAHARPYFGGGGHNGPDLNGPSIPIAVDRVMKKDELEKAVTGCVTDLVNQVGSQFTRQDMKFRITGNQPWHETADIRLHSKAIEEFEYDTEVAGSFQESVLGNDGLCEGAMTSVEGNVRLSGYKTKRPDGTTDSSVYFQISLEDRRSCKSSNYETSKNGSIVLYTNNLPFLTFDPIYGHGSLDDFGRPVSNEIKAFNIRMYLPKALNDAEPLYNVYSGAKTKATINLVKYVDCIKASIQGQE